MKTADWIKACAGSGAGYRPPPRRHNAAGDERRFGMELEFSGIDLAQAGEAVARALGGEVESCSEAEQRVAVKGLGSFSIERDWAFLKAQAGRDRPADWVKPLSEVAALLVPLEVVCPPLRLAQLPQLDAIVDALRQAGAQGTEESLVAAYGVHINSEIPQLDGATLHAYLTAFALLQWWLVDAHQVDLARRISPYIDLYPQAYVRHLLDHADAELDQISADYLHFNPSRNRALDLLPLLASIDAERVRQRVDDARIKPRPAFHYRLPNCQIEQPDWSLAAAWNTWWLVEALADRPEQRARLGQDYLAAERPLLGVSRADWVEHVDQWLRDHALV